MSHDDNDDTWLVQLENGDVRMMTVDQLDEAFQAGTISEDTLVRRDGTTKWIKLSEELGGEEAHEHRTEHEEAAAPPQEAAAQPSVPEAAPTNVQAAAPTSVQAAAPTSVQEAAPASQEAPPSAPPTSVAVAGAPKPVESVSTQPVVTELADDAHHELERSLRNARRRRWVVGGLVTATVVGALGTVTVVNVMRMRAHAALVAQLQPEIHVAASSDPEPEPSVKNDPKSPQRRRRTRTTQGPGQPADDKPASTVFQNGGDQYDPLNGKL